MMKTIKCGQCEEGHPEDVSLMKAMFGEELTFSPSKAGPDWDFKWCVTITWEVGFVRALDFKNLDDAKRAACAFALKSFGESMQIVGNFREEVKKMLDTEDPDLFGYNFGLLSRCDEILGVETPKVEKLVKVEAVLDSKSFPILLNEVQNSTVENVKVAIEEAIGATNVYMVVGPKLLKSLGPIDGAVLKEGDIVKVYARGFGGVRKSHLESLVSKELDSKELTKAGIVLTEEPPFVNEVDGLEAIIMRQVFNRLALKKNSTSWKMVEAFVAGIDEIEETEVESALRSLVEKKVLMVTEGADVTKTIWHANCKGDGKIVRSEEFDVGRLVIEPISNVKDVQPVSIGSTAYWVARLVSTFVDFDGPDSVAWTSSASGMDRDFCVSIINVGVNELCRVDLLVMQDKLVWNSDYAAPPALMFDQIVADWQHINSVSKFVIPMADLPVLESKEHESCEELIKRWILDATGSTQQNYVPTKPKVSYIVRALGTVNVVDVTVDSKVPLVDVICEKLHLLKKDFYFQAGTRLLNAETKVDCANIDVKGRLPGGVKGIKSKEGWIADEIWAKMTDEQRSTARGVRLKPIKEKVVVVKEEKKVKPVVKSPKVKELVAAPPKSNHREKLQDDLLMGILLPEMGTGTRIVCTGNATKTEQVFPHELVPSSWGTGSDIVPVDTMVVVLTSDPLHAVAWSDHSSASGNGFQYQLLGSGSYVTTGNTTGGLSTAGPLVANVPMFIGANTWETVEYSLARQIYGSAPSGLILYPRTIMGRPFFYLDYGTVYTVTIRTSVANTTVNLQMDQVLGGSINEGCYVGAVTCINANTNYATILKPESQSGGWFTLKVRPSNDCTVTVYSDYKCQGASKVCIAMTAVTEMENQMNAISSGRLIGSSVRLSSTGQELYKGGSMVMARLPDGVDWTEAFRPNAFDWVSGLNSSSGVMEGAKGGFLWHKPSGPKDFEFKQNFRTLGGQLQHVECPFEDAGSTYVMVYKAPIETERDHTLTLNFNYEFASNSQFFTGEEPELTIEECNEVLDRLKKIPFGTCNPDHVAILEGFIRKYWPKVRPFVKPVVNKLIDVGMTLI